MNDDLEVVQAKVVRQGQTGPIEIESVPTVPEESVASIMARLVFDWDGTISREQLVGVPQELVDRITSPDFVAHARASIRQARRAAGGLKKTGRRESRRGPLSFHGNGEGLNRRERRILGITKK